MSLLDLTITLSNIESIQSDLLQNIKQKVDAKLILDLCDLLRYEGCGNYLFCMEADDISQLFYDSGKAYLQLLQSRTKHQELDEYYLVKSRAYPLLDAIAAGACQLAHQISSQLTMMLNERMEYADDYYYFTLICLLLSEEKDSNLIKSTLQLFEDSLEGGSSYRYDVLASIIDHQEADFNEALASLIEEWHEKIIKQRQGESISIYYDKTAANIFVEGIALIRLAMLCGLNINEQFSFIPQEIVTMKPINFSDEFSIIN